MADSCKRCSARVYSRWDGKPCARNAVIDRDGKGYCKQHDPVAIAERRAAKEEAERAASKRAHAAMDARREAARLAAIHGASDAEILAEVERRGLGVSRG